MKLSPTGLKWALTLYPPLFFQRVTVRHVSEDFRSVDVRIHKSFLNMNYNGTIFGGTIYSAADPFYIAMFWQIFRHKGIKTLGWLKSGSVQYKKPGSSFLDIQFRLSEEDVEEAEHTMNTLGKFSKVYHTEAKDKNGEVCAIFSMEVWMRKVVQSEEDLAGF